MIKYGLDIKAPTTIQGDDGWRPIMVNEIARKKFATIEDLFRFEDEMKRSNATLITRVVEVQDDDPTFSV